MCSAKIKLFLINISLIYLWGGCPEAPNLIILSARHRILEIHEFHEWGQVALCTFNTQLIIQVRLEAPVILFFLVIIFRYDNYDVFFSFSSGMNGSSLTPR